MRPFLPRLPWIEDRGELLGKTCNFLLSYALSTVINSLCQKENAVPDPCFIHFVCSQSVVEISDTKRFQCTSISKSFRIKIMHINMIRHILCQELSIK